MKCPICKKALGSKNHFLGWFYCPKCHASIEAINYLR